MGRITKESYFAKPAEEVAEWLLGKILCRKSRSGDNYSWRIIETEAYPEGISNRTDDIYKSVGILINDGGTGLEITCKNRSGHDNVLIRGAVAIFDSHPYKFRCAFGYGSDGYPFINKTINILDMNSDIFIFDDNFNIDRKNLIISQNQPKNFKIAVNNISSEQLLGNLDIPFSKRRVL